MRKPPIPNMYYPRIDGNEPEAEIVKMLGRQVAELLEKNSFRAAMNAVLCHRYNGRFREFRKKVAQFLQLGAAASRKKGKQLELMLL